MGAKVGTVVELIRRGVKIQVVDRKTKLPLPILELDGRHAGTIQVVCPTNTEYEIVITKIVVDKDLFMTLKGCKVGSKPVRRQRHGQDILFGSEIRLSGWEEGGETFKFVSRSSWDRASNRELPTDAEENKSNIIEIEIQLRRRKENEVMKKLLESMRSSSSYDCWDSSWNSPYMMGGSMMKDGGGAKSGGSWGSESYDLSTLTGGATVSGSGTVGKIGTESTFDTFDPEGEPIKFMVQLVCAETDLEKDLKNSPYYDELRRIFLEQAMLTLAKLSKDEKTVDERIQVLIRELAVEEARKRAISDDRAKLLATLSDNQRRQLELYKQDPKSFLMTFDNKGQKNEY